MALHAIVVIQLGKNVGLNWRCSLGSCGHCRRVGRSRSWWCRRCWCCGTRISENRQQASCRALEHLCPRLDSLTQACRPVLRRHTPLYRWPPGPPTPSLRVLIPDTALSAAVTPSARPPRSPPPSTRYPPIAAQGFHDEWRPESVAVARRAAHCESR
jgi:hypothetical protein